MNQTDNSANIELRETVKVYYPMTSELQEKARKFGVSSRKKYITLENNPFGMKADVLFSGTGVDKAMSEVRINFLRVNADINDKDNWSSMREYIKVVSQSIAYDTIVSAKGKMKKGSMFNIHSDVERDSINYDDFFYDEEKEQIYRWEVVQ